MKVTRISFARICVVISIDGQYPDKFMVETKFGSKFEVMVEYGWLSKKYDAFFKHGHTT